MSSKKKELEAEEPDIRIEDVFESIGGYGKFQKIFTFLALFPHAASSMIALSPIFTGTEHVPLFCSNRTSFDPETCGVNCTEPQGNEMLSSIVQEWDLYCSRSWIVELITSCQMAGMMTGALVSSLIADRFGRTKGYFFITLGMGIFGMLPAIAWDPISYTIARFLAGVGMGGSFTVYLVHLMEFLTPSWRAVCGCVSFWPLGEMLLGLVAYLVPSWRYITIATAIPAYVVLPFLPYIQESPRWLLTRKRTKEAYEIFRKIARWNNKPPPQVATIEALQATILREETDVLRGIEGVKQILRDSNLRLLLAILTWANMTCAIVYYGVAYSTKNLSGSPYLNVFYMGIMDILVIPVSLVMNNRVGRKKAYIGCTSLCTCFVVAIIVMHFWDGLSETYPFIVTGFALVARFGIVCCWTTLYTITMETFPTTLRSSCMGWTVYASYLAGIFAPQTNVLSRISPVLPYILYAFLSTSTLAMSFFLRDTSKDPLKDTMNS